MEAPAVPALIEGLSRALLARRVTPEQFAERLIVLHTMQQDAAARHFVPEHILATIVAAAEQAVVQPRSLRVVYPPELVQRATKLGDALVSTAVQAGVYETRRLHNGQALLLLAALDRLLTTYERRAAQGSQAGAGAKR